MGSVSQKARRVTVVNNKAYEAACLLHTLFMLVIIAVYWYVIAISSSHLKFQSSYFLLLTSHLIYSNAPAAASSTNQCNSPSWGRMS